LCGVCHGDASGPTKNGSARDHRSLYRRAAFPSRLLSLSYAVLSFGGFLGIGDDHYPLPWQSLKYDTNLGGYRTGVTESQLKGAPKYSNDNAWNWNDPARARSVNDYYGVAI